MKLDWTEQATRGWREVATYIRQDFGQQGLRLFKQRTKECEAYIAKFPKGSEVAWVDEQNGVEYRWRPIYGRSKLLYFVQDDTIIVADFWDVRSNR